MIYTLFYQVCILGPIDMAKVWMLRSNTKVIGIFYCIMCGFSNCIQSLALEYLIKVFVTTNKDVQGTEGKYKLVVQDILELLCCLIAIAAIWRVLKEERGEVKMI